MEPESEAAISLEILSNKGIIPLTAFSNFIATQTSSSKEQIIAQVHEHLGTSVKGMTEEVGGILNFKICFMQRIVFYKCRALHVEIFYEFKKYENFI